MEAFVKIKQADSDSRIMENTLKITVFHLFGKLPLKHDLKRLMDLD